MRFSTRKTRSLIVLAALAALGGVALRPSIRGNDGVGYYVYLASMLRGGDLDFTDDYLLYDQLKQYPYHFTELPVCSQTGRPSNRYGVGSALLWAPFVGITHGSLKIFTPAQADGVGRPYEWAVGVGTVFWGTLGLWMLFVRLARRWGEGPAAAAIFGLVLASPLGFYLYAHGSMAHGTGFFAAAGLALALERGWRHPTVRHLAWVGAWGSLLVMIRAQDATWAVLAGGAVAGRCFCLNTRGPLCRRLGALAAMALAGAVVFAPQLLTWKILYGSWLSGPAPYLDDSAGSFSLWPRHAWEALFSERGGVLAWHPLFALGLAGLVILCLRRSRVRAMAALGLAGFGLQLWLVGCWSIWWAGASFGNRFFISALPWLAYGLAHLAARKGPGKKATLRPAFAALLAVLAVWNLGLLLQYATQMIPREDAVAWSRVIKQNLLDVPRWILKRLRF